MHGRLGPAKSFSPAKCELAFIGEEGEEVANARVASFLQDFTNDFLQVLYDVSA